jgi:hypothetical protein
MSPTPATASKSREAKRWAAGSKDEAVKMAEQLMRMDERWRAME